MHFGMCIVLRLVLMKPHGFDNLGATAKKVDERDIMLGAVKAVPSYTFPAKLDNTTAYGMPVEYQGKQPACGAHSGTALNGIRMKWRYSPRFTWREIKQFDGHALADGTDMRSIFKSLQKQGAATFSLIGNDVNMSLEDYVKPQIPAGLYVETVKHAIPGYGFAGDLTFNGLKQYIYDRGAVILLIRVSERFWSGKNGKPSWKEKDILPLATPDVKFPVVSGHFVVAHSYDEKYIYFLNSFSDAWGRNGHGYFGSDYMPWVLDAGAVVPLAFKQDLWYGMDNEEVRQLQVLLNKNPSTQLTSSGPGSPGQETTFFGTITKGAVVRFQQLHAIKPALGYVGALTRAVLNTI